MNTETKHSPATVTIEKLHSIDPTSSNFTADEVIEAYFKGLADGESLSIRAGKALLEANLKRAIPVWNTVYKYIEKNSIKIEASYLKIETVENFRILMLVSEDDFANEKFLKVYSFVSDIEQTENEAGFSVEFTFTYSTGEFNEHCLQSEGYTFKI